MAATALLTMPAAGWAQQTSSPASRQPGQSTAGHETHQHESANEHLRQAEAALNDIPSTSISNDAKTRIAELKRHINALKQTSASPAKGADKAGAAPGSSRQTAQGNQKAKWETEVATVDRIVTELLGTDSTTGASTPTGTTGSKSAMTTALDEAARAKLQAVRTHVTAFAAAMRSASSSTQRGAAANQPEMRASAAETASTSAAAPASTTADRPSAGTRENDPTVTTADAADRPVGTSGTTQQTPASEQSSTAGAATSTSSSQPPSGSQQVDTEAVRGHLTAARDTLSQLTQLPAAAQLTGDARTHVSQLISNFNELITTNTDWRAAYAKVQGNLTALLGDTRGADPAPTPAPEATAPTPVGTTGAVGVDPAIREKLVEFRNHLIEFERKAGGGAASTGTGAPTTSSPAGQPSPTGTTSSNPSSTSPATTEAASTTATAGAAAESATSTSEAIGTSGRSSDLIGTAGTSGITGATTPGSSADPQTTQRPATATQQAGAQATGEHNEAMRHIDAIEAILNGRSAAGTSRSSAEGTRGQSTTAATTGGVAGTTGENQSRSTSAESLSAAQIEQIRTHLTELRRLLNQAGAR